MADINICGFSSFDALKVQTTGGRDGILIPIKQVCDSLKSLGHRVSLTQGVSPDAYNVLINPRRKQLQYPFRRSPLIVRWEPPNVRGDLWQLPTSFGYRLASWSTSSESEDYIRCPMPVHLNMQSRIDPSKYFQGNEKSLICMVNAYKLSSHSIPEGLDGYKHRLRLIKQAYAFKRPLSLYGSWPTKSVHAPHLFKNSGYKALALNPKSFFPQSTLSKSINYCYKGGLNHKSSLSRMYHFSLCIENYFHDDYHTEKLFDSLNSGLIPIYLGSHKLAMEVPDNLIVRISPTDTFEDIYQKASSFKSKYLNPESSEYENICVGSILSPILEKLDLSPNNLLSVIMSYLCHA